MKKKLHKRLKRLERTVAEIDRLLGDDGATFAAWVLRQLKRLDSRTVSQAVKLRACQADVDGLAESFVQDQAERSIASSNDDEDPADYWKHGRGPFPGSRN